MCKLSSLPLRPQLTAASSPKLFLSPPAYLQPCLFSEWPGLLQFIRHNLTLTFGLFCHRSSLHLSECDLPTFPEKMKWGNVCGRVYKFPGIERLERTVLIIYGHKPLEGRDPALSGASRPAGHRVWAHSWFIGWLSQSWWENPERTCQALSSASIQLSQPFAEQRGRRHKPQY